MSSMKSTTTATGDAADTTFKRRFLIRLTAVLIGPLTQFVVIPSMTDGVAADAIGSWFGTGADRGIALVFVLAGLVGLAGTLLALASRPYRALSAAVDAAGPGQDAEPPARPADAPSRAS